MSVPRSWKIRIIDVMKSLSLLIIFLLVVLAVPAHAQNASFTASVDKNRVAIGEQFELTFTLEGSGGGSTFVPPPFNDFMLLSGPNQSTNMQFINGSMSSSVTYSYVLQPKAQGKFTIGPASIVSNGKQLRTQPITVEVAKGAPQQAQRGGGQQQNNQQEDLSRQIGDNLFLRVTVDRAKVYQGEQLTATYKIYTRVNVANYEMTKVPSLTGFWNEDLDVPKQIQLTTETLNGKQYRVGILKKVALFPQRAGTIELDPMEVQCVVQVQTRRRSNDLFDQFFNDPFFGSVSNVNYKVRSEPLKVSVQPLPANAPKGFTGAVGKFTIETWLDKHEAKTNDPITMRVKISGRGNLKLVEAPSFTVPPDLDRYDPKISDNIDRQGGLISGSRTFEYLLIPRHPGDQKIASFPFSYFDIEKKSYVTYNSPDFSISVARGNEPVASNVTGVSKEDVKLLGEDIRFIKSGDLALVRKGETFYGSPVFLFLSMSPFAVFVGFLLIVRRREKVLGDVALLKNRKARKLAQRQLSRAKKFLEASKKEEFYAEVSRALWGYISNKLNIPPADLSTDVMQQSLATHHVAEDVIGKFTATIQQCEFARFAPSTDSMEMGKVYEGAVQLISDIEDQLR